MHKLWTDGDERTVWLAAFGAEIARSGKYPTIESCTQTKWDRITREAAVETANRAVTLYRTTQRLREPSRRKR